MSRAFIAIGIAAALASFTGIAAIATPLGALVAAVVFLCLMLSAGSDENQDDEEGV